MYDVFFDPMIQSSTLTPGGPPGGEAPAANCFNDGRMERERIPAPGLEVTQSIELIWLRKEPSAPYGALL